MLIHTTHATIDGWLAVYRDATPLPVPLLEEGAAWLHRHAPAAARVMAVAAHAPDGYHFAR